jgi:hypothetical protein
MDHLDQVVNGSTEAQDQAENGSSKVQWQNICAMDHQEVQDGGANGSEVQDQGNIQ